MAPMPPASATADTANAERSTTDRSVIAAHPNVAVAIRPSARSSAAQSSSACMPMAATLIGTRNVPRWNSAPAVAGRDGLEAATGEQEAAGGEEEDTELQRCRGWRPS